MVFFIGCYSIKLNIGSLSVLIGGTEIYPIDIMQQTLPDTEQIQD